MNSVQKAQLYSEKDWFLVTLRRLKLIQYTIYLFSLSGCVSVSVSVYRFAEKITESTKMIDIIVSYVLSFVTWCVPLLFWLVAAFRCAFFQSWSIFSLFFHFVCAVSVIAHVIIL